jgi:bla regulator protein blaR1
MIAKHIAILKSSPSRFAAGTLLAAALISASLIYAQGSSAQSTAIPEWQTAAGGKMSFDVASIRPIKPGDFTPPTFPLSSDDAYTTTGGIFTADFPLTVYIEFAYKLRLSGEERDAMLAHLPKWVSTDNFEIHARTGENATATREPTKDQMRLMMQSLLADRFKLAIHFETRQTPVLALILVKPGKLGPSLRPHADGPACDPNAKLSIPTTDSVFPPICDAYMLKQTPDHILLAGSRNTTMELVAASLPTLAKLGRPVVDQTGLTGRYDFTLRWTPESDSPISSSASSSGANSQPDPSGTRFDEALREQLGLKLKSAITPLEIPVIDHIEQPTEN